MLTGDQNIIDIAYSVRWNIRDPESYLFEVAEPEDTIRQVAESAMRAVVSRVTLEGAIGDQRGPGRVVALPVRRRAGEHEDAAVGPQLDRAVLRARDARRAIDEDRDADAEHRLVARGPADHSGDNRGVASSLQQLGNATLPDASRATATP